MTTSPLIVSPEDRPRALKVAGTAITILASGAQTAGYEIFHTTGAEGMGPGDHSHPWDESFYVISGQLSYVIDGTAGVAGSGTLVHVPGGSTHSYKFGQGGIEMISMTSREGASRMYVDFDREGSWGDSDRAKLIALAAKHGQVVPKAG